jgi:hypothetical protein
MVKAMTQVNTSLMSVALFEFEGSVNTASGLSQMNAGRQGWIFCRPATRMNSLIRWATRERKIETTDKK